MKNIQTLKSLPLKNIGFKFFNIGTFFLPSATFIGILFLFSASIIGSFIQKENYLKSIYGKLFFLYGILITLSSLVHKFVINKNFENLISQDAFLTGIGNWIPFLWIFWALQPYLYSKENRKNFAILLISGSVPLIVGGFGQYFFNMHGPFEVFDGLIIWYQRSTNNGLTSIFNNQNYAGSWFNFLLPFCVALFFVHTKNYLKKSISLLFLISVGFSIILTNSRNAWGGIFFAIPIVVGYQTFLWLIPTLFLISLIILICISPLFSGDLQDLFRSLIPFKVWKEFSVLRAAKLEITRLGLIQNGLKLSFLSPFFGFGATAFAAILEYNTGIKRAHVHNLLIETAISYGYPAAIVLFLTVSIILIFSFKKIFISTNNLNFFERAWWASISFFLISQLFDAQYFEGKISIVFWILLAGLKNILDEDNESNET